VFCLQNHESQILSFEVESDRWISLVLQLFLRALLAIHSRMPSGIIIGSVGKAPGKDMWEYYEKRYWVGWRVTSYLGEDAWFEFLFETMLFNFYSSFLNKPTCHENKILLI